MSNNKSRQLARKSGGHSVFMPGSYVYSTEKDVQISEAIREYIFNRRDDFQEIFGKHTSEIDKVVESSFKDTKFYTKK